MTKVTKISAPRMLIQQHRYFSALRWKLEAKMRRSSIMDMQFGSQTVALRVGTPDFSVANSCLSGEFDEVIATAGDIADGLVIDAGGYIGTAAIAFAKAYPQATIVTLEPSADNFAMLTRNIAGYPNIVAINKALGAERGTIELKNRGTGQWGFTIVADPLDRPAETVQTVEITTVADVLAMVGRDRIDVFKIDIEGGEVGLLSRNNEWIAQTRVLCAELHDRIIEGCTTTFEAATAGRNNRQLDGEKIMSVA